jgi:hypothetical protein
LTPGPRWRRAAASPILRQNGKVRAEALAKRHLFAKPALYICAQKKHWGVDLRRLSLMEEGKYWRLRASEMRERATHIKDPFVSGGFRALADQYEQLAQGGARWLESHLRSAAADPVVDASAESGRAPHAAAVQS